MSKKKDTLRNILSLVIILVLVVGGVGLNKYLENNAPQAKRQETEYVAPLVEVEMAEVREYDVMVKSHGVVAVSKRSVLSSEVTGKVIEVSPRLKVGEVLEEGEVVIRVDDTDYQADLSTAKTSLIDAQTNLQLEQARANQALRDWKKLGRGEPSDLVARKPQLAAAKARIDAVEVQIQIAERTIAKTAITAPYKMKVMSKHTEIGNFVTSGGRIVEGHAVEDYEVRLPIPMDEYQFIAGSSETNGAELLLNASIGGQLYEWEAYIDRSEGGIDTSTVSIPVIVIVKPSDDGVFPYPPPGLLVKASISAKTITDKIVIPRLALRTGNKVLTVDGDNRLHIRQVEIVYTDKNYAVISSGIEEGEFLVVSPIEAPVDDMLVKTKVLGETVNSETQR